MAKHTWEAETFETGTLDTGLEALQVAVRQTASFDLACSFAGYVLETIRQTGSRGGRNNPRGYWAGAVKSGFRFNKGKNAANYLLVGRKVLSALAPRFRPTGEGETVAPEMVWDVMLESL